MGVPTVWKVEMAMFDQNDEDEYFTPFACRRLSNPSNGRFNRSHDTSGRYIGTDSMCDNCDRNANDVVTRENPDEVEKQIENIHDNAADRNVWVVRNLSMDYFRDRLIEHFDLLWQENKIKWPSRRGQQ
jgi:hypothetical protein